MGCLWFLWKSYGFLWGSYGKPMGNFWESFGILWDSYGHPMAVMGGFLLAIFQLERMRIVRGALGFVLVFGAKLVV